MSDNVKEECPVRIADTDDFEEIMEILRRMHAEMGEMPLSEYKVKAILHRALAGHDGIVGVIGDTGRIEATTCLVLNAPWYSDHVWLGDYWTYVLPEHRASKNYVNLISFAKRLCERQGNDLKLVMGFLNSGNVQSKEIEVKLRLLNRHLGTPSGAMWVYRGDDAVH